MTATIQPPLLAWPWRIAVGDPAEVPAIVRHQDRVERGRAIDGDGLLWIVQPDESGLDAPPKLDSAFGWRADGLPAFRSSSGATARWDSTSGGSSPRAGRSFAAPR